MSAAENRQRLAMAASAVGGGRADLRDALLDEARCPPGLLVDRHVAREHGGVDDRKALSLRTSTERMVDR
jgi:hypothetical protein